MSKFPRLPVLSKPARIIIALVLIAALAVISYRIYDVRNTKLLDRNAFKEFETAFKEAAESEDAAFTSQDDLMNYIKRWAVTKELKYEEDKHGNIIFDRPAVKRKSKVTPTLIIVSANYETAKDNAPLYAAAASIALSDMEYGRTSVVFADDSQGLGKGYKGLSKEYLSSKAKVIYMDYGSSSYLSTSSFEQIHSSISVPASKEDNPCDTAVKINIDGIRSGIAGPGISKQPDPVAALSTLLTRLKSRSYEYRISDISLVSNGDMYPVSIEATIAINSYNLGAFTSYIDKRIKAWDRAYGRDFEDAKYTYEVIDDPEAIPKTCYDAGTADTLAGLLYTLKTGSYKYADEDIIPDGRESGDTFGINLVNDIKAGDKSITIYLLTQAYDDEYTSRIISDCKAVCELNACNYKELSKDAPFLNDRGKLSHNFSKTYERVNPSASGTKSLKMDSDNYFTPCSYLAGRNPKSDIIHLRLNSGNSADMANSVLCYIKTKGNTSFF